MNKEDMFIHLFAGGFAGTTAAILTCPLEVVKTRLQSSGSAPSNSNSSSSSSSSSSKIFRNIDNRSSVPKLDSSIVAQFHRNCKNKLNKHFIPLPQQLQQPHYASPSSSAGFTNNVTNVFRLACRNMTTSENGQRPRVSLRRLTLYQHLLHIVKTEGVLSLWRGVGPTLIGVAPSRAIYFCAYSNSKAYLNRTFVPETPFVHFCSAFMAGFFQTTCTNPIWMIRTRLQLDRMTLDNKLTIRKCIKKVYQENGVKGFYRGVTASYFGISETVIYFVIYERLKLLFVGDGENGQRRMYHFLELMMCAAASRMVASSIAYPHEVARTRLREEGDKYRRFFQTLATVVREESWRGLYSGIGTNLVRTIPNTAITMGTYELVVYLLKGT